METFGLKNIPFFATSRFSQFWQILSPDAFTNAQHSISDSLVILPKMVTSVIHSQHIQIWQNLLSVFIVLPICGFWLPFLKNLDIGFFDTYILSSGEFAKML